MQKVKQVYGDKLLVNWRNFVLEQANSKEGDGWLIWDQPDSYPSRGLPAFRAAEAARLQGDDAYERMHFALLEGRHENRKDFTDPADLEELAKVAGLDVGRFKLDISNRGLLKRISEDHVKGSTEHFAFGTPTFVFENGSTFFMRIKAPDSPEESARLFDNLCELYVESASIDEVKRPHIPRD
ncbi:hypothetical protein M1O29_02585 [Dehalococcoidia bacterium]|nr:hypothetical protein [Dehalococcoidia bacterium]